MMPMHVAMKIWMTKAAGCTAYSATTGRKGTIHITNVKATCIVWSISQMVGIG